MMDCRETQTQLTAFHDGELPAADRARVEEHLRGCPECRAQLADLGRADQAAGVPDPGPAYWDRFNARVMDRVEREADGPKVAILKPKHGWMRQQLRYLVPAAAAAALVVGIVRYGGMNPGAPTPAVPSTARDGLAPGQAGMPRDLSPRPVAREPAAPVAPGSKASARTSESSDSAAEAQRVPQTSVTGERMTAVTREERDRLADRTGPAGIGETAQDRAAAPAAVGVPSPPPVAFQRAPDDQGRPGAGAGRDATGSVAPAARAESASGMNMAKDQPAEAPTEAPLGKTRSKAGPSPLASGPSRTASPCELARTLAEGKRIREAENAQRACLAGELPAPSRERGLVFLAELLDRQARFAEADAVIAEVDRRFPQSPPLELYRQQRPMVQKQPMAIPVTR